MDPIQHRRAFLSLGLDPTTGGHWPEKGWTPTDTRDTCLEKALGDLSDSIHWCTPSCINGLGRLICRRGTREREAMAVPCAPATLA